MKNVKLGKVWDELHSSYWFIPTLMAVAAIALAFTMLTLDRTGKAEINSWWSYTGGADGARSLLGAVAGSMVSVCATAFSITIVALQLAASSFGPRLLRNFMQDTGNQIVLGTFIGTFIYCLLVLRTIHGEGDGYSLFVPQLSVTGGTLLAIISIGVLIYFIHHASTIIQASYVIQNVSTDLDSVIERLFPQKIGRGKPEQDVTSSIPVSFEEEACPIRASSTGYLQAIDDEELINIACKYNLLVRLATRPGKFVVKGSDLVMVFPEERVNAKLVKQINDAFILGIERNEQQDIEFPIDQLVEIAMRGIEFLKKIVTHTEKTRYLFQLAKGIEHHKDDGQTFVYRDVPQEELHVPLTQVIYVGDGASDIPCFSLLNQEQGVAIGVYKSRTPQDWGRELNITQSQRVVNLAPADYSENSELMQSLMLALESVCKQISLHQLSVGE
ncbi:MAG: DUF2254 domain-containing protein [Microcoleus sp. SIO2G3]|nr:DUF2254 domain-containing protein [Microcoleus sp. SIO2G3]